MEVFLPPGIDALPKHREKLEALCLSAMEHAQILGMAIGGSLASGVADEYSDLDLQLIVDDGSFDQVQELLRPLADPAGRVVSAFRAEHVGFPHMLIVLYDDLIHVDLEPVRTSDVASRNAGLRTHVLWERGAAVSSGLGAEPEDGLAAQVASFEARMWTWSWYVQAKILRGELYEALDGIQFLRDRVLFPLLARHRGALPSGSRRAEDQLGEWADRFAATVPSLDRESVMRALRATVELYIDLADPLLERSAVHKNAEGRRVALSALESGLAWRPA